MRHLDFRRRRAPLPDSLVMAAPGGPGRCHLRRAGIGLVVLAVLAASTLVRGQAAPHAWTSTDHLKIKNLGDVQIAPDGKRIAYTVESNERAGRAVSQIWIWDMAAGTASRLGGERDTGSSPRWSPDSQWVAYLGRAEDESGLVIARMDGTPPLFLARVVATNHPLPSTGDVFAWSPGNSRIAFVSGMPGPEGAEANGDPMVITRYLYKPTASEGLTRFNDNRRLQLFMVDLVTREPRQLTDDHFYNHSLAWSPKGDEILFVSNREADADRVFNYDVFAYSVARQNIRRLSETRNAEYQPRWAPNGSAIAMLATTRPLTSSETTMEDTHVWVMKPDGRERREVGAAIDNRQGAPQWSADGTSLYFTVQERGDVRLYRVPVAGGPPAAVAPAAGEHGVVGAWSIATNGTVAYALALPGAPAEVYVRDGAGPPKRLTSLNDQALRDRTVQPVERFAFAGEGGMEVEAFLTKPAGQTGTSRHPLIVMIHGGPHGQQGPAFNLKAQVYAAKGWASLMVNYRGSTGYGQKFADAIFKDQDGAEARDVLAGVDAALARHPWIDATRLGIEGGSYGGQLTNWILTQSDRFKAAIPSAGIANLISFNYTAYYHDYLAVEFGANPRQPETMDLLWERSPLRHVNTVKTPTLIVHGENDNDVPISEAEQWYIALKDVGVDTVLVRYPREGHGVREPKHVVDLMDRSIAWYEKYFGATATPARK